MKTLTIRLSDPLAAEIEAESRARKITKSDVVRERLHVIRNDSRRAQTAVHAIADLIGSVAGLPSDLSKNKKRYLKAGGYGQKPPR